MVSGYDSSTEEYALVFLMLLYYFGGFHFRPRTFVDASKGIHQSYGEAEGIQRKLMT